MPRGCVPMGWMGWWQATRLSMSAMPSGSPLTRCTWPRLRHIARHRQVSRHPRTTIRRDLLQYSAPLNAFGSNTEWFARGDVSYRDEMFIDEINLETIEARTLVNLRAGIDTGKVRFTVFVENATDQDAPTSGFRFGQVALVGLPMPRQVGATVTVAF